VVAEQDREKVESLRSRGLAAVCGDAAEPAVLIQAHIARANLLVITAPDSVASRRMVETARALNPEVKILARAGSGEDAETLRREQAGQVFVAEEELAGSMIRQALAAMMARPEGGP